MTNAKMPQPINIPGVKSISDVVDTSLWPDLPQVDNDDLADSGEVIILEDVRELHGENGSYYVVKCSRPADRETPFTTLMGGVVLVEKLRAVAAATAFPVAGKLIKVPVARKGYSPYFDFIGPNDPLPRKLQQAGGAQEKGGK